MEIEFFHNVLPVSFNGFSADVKVAAKFLRALAFSDSSQDFLLPNT
jgi:hypothetical protein